MRKTNTFLAAALVLVVSACFGVAANVELTPFGSAAFTVDGGSTTAFYTQSASSLTFTNFSDGSYLNGTLTSGSANWSLYTNAPYTGFALNMSVSGTNPDAGFSLDLYNSAFDIIDTYTGSTTNVATTLQLVNLSLSASGTQNYSDVVGLRFTWNGPLESPNTVTVEGFYSIVPEPSTYALLAMSGVAFGGYVIRRRRR